MTKHTPKPKTWGDEFQRHVSNGCDHADAAFRADKWLQMKNQHARAALAKAKLP